MQKCACHTSTICVNWSASCVHWIIRLVIPGGYNNFVSHKSQTMMWVWICDLWICDLTALLYLYMCACKCQLLSDEGSRTLQKHLNYCFSSIWVYLATQV